MKPAASDIYNDDVDFSALAAQDPDFAKRYPIDIRLAGRLSLI